MMTPAMHVNESGCLCHLLDLPEQFNRQFKKARQLTLRKQQHLTCLMQLPPKQPVLLLADASQAGAEFTACEAAAVVSDFVASV